ncbi:efflux RND transporter periplasmic adaptor subunit [Oceanobacter mangrovi]|uniref:efflux RND transporter periplasmic adaptor subunit n=1 Tax=Oceanobacter mangrovi TaxID=2862510 RepID=UPI001C8EE0A6|nr:efflux RND transporter periplasmic adaptor subunit [Oceanobacter mangrovi]
MSRPSSLPRNRLSLAAALLVTATGAFTMNAHAVESSVIQPSTIADFYDLEATLEAVNESTISAQTSGQILTVHYDVNDQVSKGALLIEIENSQQKAQLAQANANLAQAKAQNEDAQTAFKRNARLFKQGSISQGQYDSSEAQAKSAAAAVEAATAAVEQARLALSYTRVTAPYAGYVKARLVETGELVNPGQPLMTGMALSPLRAVADVPQRLASQYQSASQVSVQLGEQSIEPVKVTLYPYADSQLHSVRLRAELPANTAGTMPGMWTKVRLQTGERQGLLVPESALIERSEVTALYVRDGSQWKMRQVRTGRVEAGQVEILAGLKAGDSIAIDGYAALAELAQAARNSSHGE